MDIAKVLQDACMAQGQMIIGLTHNGEAVHGGRLLIAISGLESSFGKKRLFVRMEPGYAPGGRYYHDSQTVRDRWATYGALAASSYGSFQMMFITAEELGFYGHPIDLQADYTCALFARRLIIDRFMAKQGVKTLGQVLDAYNSGNAKDANVPLSYVQHGIQLYQSLDSI